MKQQATQNEGHAAASAAQSLVTPRERQVARAAAIAFGAALLVGALLWGNRMRMLFAIADWQDDARVTASTSGTISVSRMACPFALGDDESASITARVSNDWTREVGIEVTFYTEDMSGGAPYAYISGEPLCTPVTLDVPPGKTADVSCTFEEKMTHWGMMPFAVKARTVAANFGPNDYDSAACPIWIVGVDGVPGEWIANLFGLISLVGMMLSALVWGLWGYFPNDPKLGFLASLLLLAGVIVGAGILIYVIHETLSCLFGAGLVILFVGWAVTRDRRRASIQSIYQTHSSPKDGS
jgi:hypothetical protein